MTWVAAALLASLAGSPHCLGMCGGFAGVVAEKKRWTAAWHAGRLATYAALGAVAGEIGASLPGMRLVSAVTSGALLLVFAAGLAGWLPAVHPPAWLIRTGSAALAARDRLGVPATFAFGVVNGLLPCGLVHTALAVPIAGRDPLWGAAWMTAFGLGTLPALAAARFGLRRALDLRPWVRPVVACVVASAGLWSISLRSQPVPEGAPPPCHQSR